MSIPIAKSFIRQTAAALYHRSKMQSWRHRGQVLILVYHRILPQALVQQRYIQPGMYVLDAVFEQQVKFMREHFVILSFHELLERWRFKNWDKHQRYCVITFDDGWFDNYVYAYPILKKYEIPAAVFVATDFIGTQEWFWPDKVSYCLERVLDPALASAKRSACHGVFEQFLDFERTSAIPFAAGKLRINHILEEVIEHCNKLPSETIQRLIEELATVLAIQLPRERCLMNWSEVAQMSQAGISFGSHSCSHRILTKLSRSDVEMELTASRRELRTREVRYLPVFCYPNGDSNEEIQNLVRDCGYQAAVGIKRGVEGESPKNMFGLPRIEIHNDIANTSSLFLFHLLAPL